MSGLQLIHAIVEGLGPDADRDSVREVLSRGHPERAGEFPNDRGGSAKLANYIAQAKRRLGYPTGRRAAPARPGQTQAARLARLADFDPAKLIRDLRALVSSGLTPDQVRAVAELVETFGAAKVNEMMEAITGLR